MTRAIICAAILAGATGAFAQDVDTVLAQRRMVELEKAQLEGKLRAAVETRTTTGAPYYAEAITEFQQTLADGNRIARKSVVRIYRDSEGRVRREDVGADGAVESVTIVDPMSGRSVVLDGDGRPAVADTRRLVVMPRGAGATLEAQRKKVLEGELTRESSLRAERSSGLVPKMRARLNEMVTRQDLGQRTIEGVTAEGTRTVTTIPAGTIGNEQPIRIVSEEWFSPDLRVLVLTKHSDPRSGETTYTLSNIVRSEPGRALFEIPADSPRK
jgi:hypothetical protein